MIRCTNNFLLINRLAFPESMGDEHHRLFVQWKVVDTGTWSLNAKVVLVLDVDAAIWFLCNFYVVGRTFEAIVAKTFIYYSPIRMQHGMHVPRVGMVIVGIHQCRKDGIGQPSTSFVNVSNGVRWASKNNSVDIDVIIVLIMDSLLPIWQHLHFTNTSVLAQVNVFNEFVKYFSDALSCILPRLTSGDVTIIITANRLEGLCIVLIGEQGNLGFNQRTKYSGEGS